MIPDARCADCGALLRWDNAQERYLDEDGGIWCPARDNLWHHREEQHP